jgi:subtilisin-like proprotein convertase family protein
LSAVSEDTPLALSDDAITTSTLFVPSARPVVEVQAGVVVEHARASDLVFHLVSPEGSRVLLAENRGQSSPDGYGDRIITTNVFPNSSNGGPEEDLNLIETGANAGILQVDYDFFVVPDSLRVYYQGVLIYDTGLISGTGSIRLPFGPGEATEITIVVNEGGSSLETTQWVYTASVITERLVYTVLTENTNRADLPIKYGTAPFTNSTVSTALSNVVLFEDDFEAYVEGVYPAPTNLGLWLVELGQVVVHGETNDLGVTAHSGTNFVELAATNEPSSLTAILETTVNRRYILNFTMQRNPTGVAGSPQVLALYTNNALAAFLPVPAGGWVTNSILLQAPSSPTAVEFRSASPVGPLIDSVQIIEVADEEEFYFLPEEFLSAFEGESAFGNWTIEMWDNRVGSGGGLPPELISWQLRFVLANTNPPAVPLVFCRPDTNTVPAYTEECEPAEFTVTRDEIKYFIVEVPRSASLATNLVVCTNDVVLLFNQDGLPTGSLPGDVIVDDFGAGGELWVLNTNELPELRPGERYYLGVANAIPTETNTFFISVAFDQTDSYLVSVLELTNAIPYSATIAVTNALDYYQYTVASNAVEVRFEITQLDGDVDLVIRKALPVQDPLPTTAAGRYDYVSRNAGTTPESIIVTPTSEPVPLEPGRWYLGVINVDTNPVNYTVQVTETVGSLTNVITLQNGVPLDFTIPAGASVTNYFLFSIADDTHSAVLFETYNLTANATLLAELGAFPDPLGFFGIDTGSPDESAQIVFRTNSGTPASLVGDWFLRVIPDLDEDLDFTIRAVVATNGVLVSGAPFELTVGPAPPPATGFELTWNTVPGERYLVSRSIDLVNWVPLGTVTAIGSTLSFQDPAPPPGTMLFYSVTPVP